MDEVLREAKLSASVTHNHPQGILGAQAIAACVFLARKQTSKEEIKRFVTRRFGYDLNRTLDRIRPHYAFDSSSKGSVPEAIIAFLESEHFEDAIRKAISIGGDSDTIASMTGAIAHAFYGDIPDAIWSGVSLKLDLKFKEVLRAFSGKYGGGVG